MPADAEPKLRSCSAAGCSLAAQSLASADFLPGLNLDLREMQVPADRPGAAVNRHGVTLVEHFPREDYRSGSHCQDWLPTGES